MNQPVKNATFLQPGWSRCITNYDAVHCYLHVQKSRTEKCSQTAAQLAVLWTEMGFLISSYYVTLAFAKLLSTTGMRGGVTSSPI